jgi:hypothetical protein
MNKITEMINRQQGTAVEEFGIHITCPYCKDGYTHFESVSQRESDNHECWEGRGGAARIAMYCEICPNLFYIRVGEHKGYSYLDIEKSFTLAKFHTTD